MLRPFVDVALTTSRPFQPPRSVEVFQEMGHHDVIRFSNFESRVSSPRWMTGALARVRYGWAPSQIADLVAYVFEPRPSSEALKATARAARNEVTCVGITYPLKGRGIESWTDVTTWWLVEEFGRRFRIRTRVDRVGKLRAAVLQKGRSHWEMLSELAKEDGLLLFVSGNTLQLRDPRLLEEEERKAARVLALRASGIGRLRKITTEMGEVTADGVSAAEYVSTGATSSGAEIVVTSRTSQYRARSSRRTFLTEFVETPVRSVAEGRAELESAERRGYFPYTAEIEADGDPAIRPGAGLHLEGVGEKASGFWIVLKAEHRVGLNDYRVVAKLGRADPFPAGKRPQIVGGRRVLVSSGADLRGPRTSHSVRRIEGRWASA